MIKVVFVACNLGQEKVIFFLIFGTKGVFILGYMVRLSHKSKTPLMQD
jgi:hypothetical protein